MAFPGVGWWPLAPAAIAAFVLSLHGRGVRAGAILGFLFGLAFFVPHLSWSGIYVGAMPWLALAALQALFFALFGATAVLGLRFPGATWLRPVVLALLWVAQEALRSRVPFGGFPWGRLAFSQADAPTLRLASLGGAPLVSFAVALAGALLAHAALELLCRRRSGRSARTVVPVTAVALAGLVLISGTVLPEPPESGRTASVAAVQGNVARAGLDFNSERRAVLDNHASTTVALAADVARGIESRPDLVLWPENASDIDPLRNPDAAAVISDAAKAIGVPLLVGTVLREPVDRLSNVSLVWNPDTGPGQRYVKRRPVPFAEYIPYRSFFRRITEKVDLVRTDFVAGEGPNVLQIGPVTAGTAICFEVAFDDLLREAVRGGADLLVVQTNNATFGRTDESRQQLAMSRLRAVELGRAVVHISTVGVSAMIAPDGEMTRVSGHYTQQTLVDRLPLVDDRTLATRVGAWPEGIMALFGLLGAVLAAAVGQPRRTTPWSR